MVTQIEANPLKIKPIIDMKAPTCINEAPPASKALARGYPVPYLSVTPQVVSSVLVREEGGKQLPIYYVSKVLNGAEGRYTPIEKVALALVVTARRLRPYFLSILSGSGPTLH
ncbi:UNVERIFIED_CONTAM: hypothetical protein Slati_4590800 [Sesamum latifolium]|uniref:Reverse transcriptase RNase H-like domain-containing protein n=1 Tax=Sesamum latifolium TaxID=2727402 RepID=A0AAW2S3G9_9LAMI